ncbi:MAG: tannase/feruloyl esterase family alpha/beta hydrolase [Limnobacter sp.]|nr:tannase/feruloyl esterase family alpha/beta hydrolase [Limnobacter sp.]
MKSPESGSRILLLSVACAFALTACSDDDDDDPAPLELSAQEACDALSGRMIAGATVNAASLVPASGTVPEYCLLSARIDPKLNFEVRLPSDWNGKLHYGGGGGFNGSIPAANANALSKGFAQVSSDSGHQANGRDGSWALDDQEALTNFAYLSIPTVTAATREIVRERYGSEPSRTYFEGCSNGGREALMNAQRFPEVFDGIIARAPAYRFTGLLLGFNRTAKALAAPGGAFTEGKVATLASAVLAACDGLDGVEDGIVSNLQACTFDASSLRCPNGGDAGDQCLSDAQLAVVDSWTSDMALGTGQHLNTGWPLTGNEAEPAGWRAWVTGDPTASPPVVPAQFSFQEGLVKYMLNKDPALDTLSYSPDANPGAVLALSAVLDSSNPNLTQFRARGGKLILWHGASDPAISVDGTTRYYNEAVAAAGGQATADQFMRYYIAPGVLHCSGGPGADQVDLLESLDAWVTDGDAPGTLAASKLSAGTPVLTRPLCVYPMYPRYNGSGDPALAASYTCTSP